jgi:hypothetical protein
MIGPSTPWSLSSVPQTAKAGPNHARGCLVEETILVESENLPLRVAKQPPFVAKLGEAGREAAFKSRFLSM